MFFVLSKLLWLFLQPLAIVGLFLALGFLISFTPWRRVSRACLALALCVLFIVSFTNLGEMMLKPLEQRFAPGSLPEHVDGIIVLGGAFDPFVSAEHGYELNGAGDRFVEAVRLARLYPDALILPTGGIATLDGSGQNEAVTAKLFFEAMGISDHRLLLEDKARNTYENGAFAKALADPKPGQTWLLVTSAFHMPRSVGIFRQVGFDVMPWPVDYQIPKDRAFKITAFNLEGNTAMFSQALHEWLGLGVYYATGKSAALFPHP